jgi:hypothetical protein
VAASPEPSQHLGVAPLVPAPGGAELAFEHPALGGQPDQRLLGDRDPQTQPRGHLGAGERPVGPCVPRHQVGQRVRHRLGERVGGPGRHRNAETVPQPRDVLDRGPPLLPGDADLHHPAGVGEQGEPVGDLLGPLGAGPGPGHRLVGAQRTQESQHVDQVLRVARPAVRGEPLELGLQVGQHRRVQQLAELGPAQQLGQQPLVQGERGRAALRERVVALVHERGDVAEQQRPRERRGLFGGDLRHRDPAGGEVPHQRDEGRHVVHVLEALAHRLQDDGEGRVLRRDREELGGPLPLLPQRGAAARVAAGEQQGPRGALPEAGREQGGAAHLGGDQVLDLVGLEEHHVRAGRVLVGLGDAEHDPVVGGQRLGVDAVPLRQAGPHRQRPGRVHLRAEGGVHHQPPVAQLVAEPLDQDGAVGGQHPGRLALLGQEGPQVVGRPRVQPGLPAAGHRGRRVEGDHLAGEGADRRAQLRRPAQLVALPERQPPRLPRGGGDQDPVVGDVLDAPARGAEREHVPDPGLVDHLLVQLSDPGGLLADQEDPEQPAVGNRAAAGHREALGARPRAYRPRHPVPHDAGAQLGELVAGVAAAEQVQRRVEGAARQGGVRRGPAGQREEPVDLPLVDRGGRDDLLGQDVERVGGHPQGLDRALPHPLDGDRGVHQVGAVLGQQHPARDLPDLVTGPADPLEAGGHAGRGLDLDHQVDRAHVDAELEAGGGDHARQPPGLEVVLDERALLLGHAAVVGLGDHLAGALGGPRLRHDLRRRGGRLRMGRSGPLGGDLVEAGGEPFGEPP